MTDGTEDKTGGALRPVAAIGLTGVTPGGSTAKLPIFEWVVPTTLMIDAKYQRDLSERSIRLIRRIVADWDWRRFKPPVVAFTPEGLSVIDGQHTSIAAACHPDIEKIPVMIVEASELADRAKAFIGHNTARLGVTAVQLHAAAVTAGDSAATAVNRACELAGVTIVRAKPGSGFKPAQTMAVAAIGAAIGRQGVDAVAGFLKVLVEAEVAPITAAQLRAVEALLSDPEFETLDPANLASTIRDLGEAGEREAKAFALTHSLPLWRGLASSWFRKCRKRRGSRPTIVKDTDEEPSPVVNITAAARSAHAAGSPSGPPKRDLRAATGAWRPGSHVRRCRDCDDSFVGHKDADQCADCAYGAPAKGAA